MSGILLDTRARHVGQNLTSRHSRVELERVIHLTDRIISFRELRLSSGQQNTPPTRSKCAAYSVVHQVRQHDVVDARRLPDRRLRGVLRA